MELRDYQRTVIERVEAAMDRGLRSTLCSLFTGAGKTVIFATLANRLAGRTLIVAPLRELVWQAVDKCRRVVGDDVEIEMAELKSTIDDGWTPPAKVVVACKQSLLSRSGDRKRYHRLSGFDLVVIDEAHMQCSEPVVEMLKHFQGDGAFVAGFTATPFRMDGIPMLMEGACDFTSPSQQTTESSGASKTDGQSRLFAGLRSSST